MIKFYEQFLEEHNQDYDSDYRECIEKTVADLVSNETDVKKPGMLLGKIQSGKTRIFIGIIALAFDKGYDISIILTKGTKVLTKQTYQRLDKVFEKFIENDHVGLYDIMNTPEELTPYSRGKKLIFVVKKQTDNLNRIVDLFAKYDDFKNKKLLIIDDEADYASIGFKRDPNQPDEVGVAVIASKIDQIRQYGAICSFLQVTATPYSLYLQPETFVLNGEEYSPVRPAFTELVPIHENYIGGDFYFEKSEDPNNPAFFLHVDVPDIALQSLGKIDRRYINNIDTTPNLKIFRQAILDFIVGGAIRRLQEQPQNYKCSFIIHTETSKVKHAWQLQLTSEYIKKLQHYARVDETTLNTLVSTSVERFNNSIELVEANIPSQISIQDEVKTALLKGYIGINKINSDQQIYALLDKKGQLRLENPFNIFIGGQILDRGITVENLICFFYGRNPKRFQLDTVLQHSRMYGYRSIKDLCVTRFYTSANIYNAMKKIHCIDSSLREAFLKGQHEDGVVFLLVDETGQVKHCAPNKILISSTETIRPYRRLLPRGMQTKSSHFVGVENQDIEKILNNYIPNIENSEPFFLTAEDAMKILDIIAKTYEYSKKYKNENYEWDVLTAKAVIKKLTTGLDNNELEGKLYCFVRINRNSSRTKDSRGGTYYDAPDDGKTDRPLAMQVAKQIPCLMLLKQKGLEEQGWRNTEFWWPVLVCPESTKTSVFAAETI
jgi:hypothetical protein